MRTTVVRILVGFDLTLAVVCSLLQLLPLALVLILQCLRMLFLWSTNGRFRRTARLRIVWLDMVNAMWSLFPTLLGPIPLTDEWHSTSLSK